MCCCMCSVVDCLSTYTCLLSYRGEGRFMCCQCWRSVKCLKRDSNSLRAKKSSHDFFDLVIGLSKTDRNTKSRRWISDDASRREGALHQCVGRDLKYIVLSSDLLTTLTSYADNRATGVRGALRSRLRNGRTSALKPDRCRLIVGSTRFPHMTHLRALIHSSPGAPLMSKQLSTTINPLQRVQFM